ncbi:MAG: DUF1648 domain-containing protein [Firmicutes bacterium]|nr:DUF1648 domain-containing protein [Bacillota bacterium]
MILAGILNLALAAAFYNFLPERVASHFDLRGTPDGWTSRAGIIGLHSGSTIFFILLNVTVAWIASREPVITLTRLGRRTLSPADGLDYLGYVTSLFLAGVFGDVYWFASGAGT